MYTVEEASRLLKTNSNIVYELIMGKQLPALKLGRIKIKRTVLLEILYNINEEKDVSDQYNIKNLEYRDRN